MSDRFQSAATNSQDGTAFRNETADDTPAPRSAAQVLKDIALFFAGPFITIAYLSLFPFIGVMMLLRNGNPARQHRKEAG